jgi:tetratricopeptide (TPR) repeat protein
MTASPSWPGSIHTRPCSPDGNILGNRLAFDVTSHRGPNIVSDNAPEEAERFAALLQQGLSLHQASRFAEAASLYAQVLERFPDHAETLDLQGVLLHQTGHTLAAVELIERAVTLRPDTGEFHNHLGVCKRELGDLEGARQAFMAATSRNPRLAEAPFNLATTLNQMGRYTEAESAAAAAVDLAPENVDARLALMTALRRQGRPEAALETLLGALDVDGLDIRLYPPLALLRTSFGQHDHAKLVARRGILVQPRAKECYVFLREVDAGVVWARRAVCLDRGDAALWTSLAVRANLAVQNHMGMAAAMRSILLAPGSTGGYENLTTCAFRAALFKLSVNAANWGLILNSSSDSLAVTAAFNAFVLGDAARGWALYGRRGGLPGTYPRIGLPPVWDGGRPAPKRLLVCAEQGVGDEYIFLSCLPDLLASAGDVIVECDRRNIALFERSFPDVGFVPRSVTQNETGAISWDYREILTDLRADAHVMAASLAGMFGVGITRPALPRGYLVSDAVEVASWRAWLRSLGSGPKVGLCWRSSVVDPIRSELYFSLDVMLAAIGSGTATYVSLLYVDGADEIDATLRETGTRVHTPPALDQREELDRVAALISCLDVVVTVDCAVCGIAAATGVPTIRLSASYFALANGRDAFFGNLFPCRDGDQAFDRSDVLRRAALKLGDLIAGPPVGETLSPPAGEGGPA